VSRASSPRKRGQDGRATRFTYKLESHPFVTEKPIPGDFDVCWDSMGVDTLKLNPVFLDFSEGRKKQKEMFQGEFFPVHLPADRKHTFLDFFQIDKDTQNAKGIICIAFKKS
jgi:hypothetical protein